MFWRMGYFLENTIKIFLVVLKKLIAGSDLNAATYMMDDIFEKLDVLFDPLTMPTYVDDVGTIMLSMFEVGERSEPALH